MEVQIISKETIKPSCSTPTHLKTFKLSLLDQIAFPVYVPIIIFFPPKNGEKFIEKSHHLKASFSQTLTHFYPLAGRIKDGFSIDCNDEGALYFEAHVSGEMSVILQEAEMSYLEKLLPMSPHDNSTGELLVAQVSYFGCGGMAISVCIWHTIGDASALASFVSSWAAVSCGSRTNFPGVDSDRVSVFPPQDITGFSIGDFVDKHSLSKSRVKRFLFNGPKISVLKQKIGSSPTRVEAVAAVIWKAVIAASAEEDDETINVASVAVNLRRKMIPPFPQLSIGNINKMGMAYCSKDENRLGCNALSKKIHDSIKEINDDYVRKMHGADGKYFQYISKMNEEFGKNYGKMRLFTFSSWCRFPFYEANFGWGKPTWVSTVLNSCNAALLLDTQDGQGIEAWITLPKQHMEKFEQNPDMCAYASFMPTPFTEI